MGAKILDPRLHGDDIIVVFHCFRKVVIPAKAGNDNSAKQIHEIL